MKAPLFGFLAVGLVWAAPAQAGLFGAGNTVQASYYSGKFGSAEGELAVDAATSDPALLVWEVNFQQGLIGIGETTISITYKAPGFPNSS